MRRLKLFAFTLLIFCGILFSSSTVQAQAGYALTIFDYNVDSGIVIGTSQTYLNPALDPYYNVGVDGYLIKYNDPYLQTYTILDSGMVNHSNNAIVITDANVQRGEIYAVFSDHWLQTAYYVGGYAYDYYGLFYGFGQTTNPSYGFLQGSPGYVYNVWILLGRTGVIVWLPNVTQIAPDAGLPDTSPVVQIAGKYIGEHSGVLPTLVVSGNGVAAQAQQTYPTGVEAVFQIAENADIGNHSVRLWAGGPPNAGGVPSNLVTFRVGDRSPVINSISPPVGNTGDTVSVTISGSDFGVNPQLLIDGTGVNATITPVSSTQIDAVFSVADITYVGARNVKVKSNGRSGMGFIPGPGNSDTSNSKPFNVTDPTVTYSSLRIVEKHGEAIVKVTVTGLADSVNDKTKFKLRTLTGTGEARFSANDTQEIILTGVQSDYPLTIKGITESSQAANITIEATINTSNEVKGDGPEFTVATISSLVFERFGTSYTQIDSNPGNGVPNTNIGERIFPDRLTPTDTMTDRSLVKVKATISPAIEGVQVYFGNYDMDDPSAYYAPIDTTGFDGNDNNGSVMIGSTPSKAGQLSIIGGSRCSATVGKAECATGAGGTITVQFKTTMQPGDNFAIAASLSEAYRNLIRVLPANGTALVGNTDFDEIHISGQANSYNTPGIRTQMLTVWRRLHIEVDSMREAHENYVWGSVSGARTIKAGRSATINVAAANMDVNRFKDGRMELAWITNALDVVSNTANTLTVRNSTANNIVIANNENFQLANASAMRMIVGTIPTGLTIASMQTVTITINSTPLDANDFANGQLYITPVLNSLSVTGNTINTIDVTNTGSSQITIQDGTNYRLYDDDDYNSNNTASLHGDENEPIVRFGDTFRHMSDSLTGGTYADGTPINILASAYILPEYSWAENTMNYNQSNVVFDRNVEEADISLLEHTKRDSIFDERPGFWIAYFIISYQGRANADSDGENHNQEGITGTDACDCYNSLSCPGMPCTSYPQGGHASFLFLEALREGNIGRSLSQGNTITETEIVAPHELGHQFGLRGDIFNSTLFAIMDYPTISIATRVGFHPEHINIMRRRVNSPGH